MRRHPRPNAFQQFKQRIIDFLLDFDVDEIVLIAWILFILVVCGIVLFNGLFHAQCQEGYVYVRGVCVQGYRP